MAEKKELVTRDYTRKAAKAYRDRHDILSLTIDNGERDKFRAVGLDNKTIIELIRAEYKRRIGEAPEPDTKNVQDAETKNPMPKPQAENREDIPFFE